MVKLNLVGVRGDDLIQPKKHGNKHVSVLYMLQYINQEGELK